MKDKDIDGMGSECFSINNEDYQTLKQSLVKLLNFCVKERKRHPVRKSKAQRKNHLVNAGFSSNVDVRRQRSGSDPVASDVSGKDA